MSNEEHQTTRFIKDQLSAQGVSILPLDMPTGVLAEITGGDGDGPTIAIRSDIDALPIVERTGLEFASCRKGVMHACGHDVHMATVLGVASLLNEYRDQFPGKVRFLFQPAEELPPGGARPMIEHGALVGVDRILGLHVEPMVPVGRIGLCDGPMMASVYDFDLIIRGEGGHAALPHLAVDAIVTAAEVVGSLQTLVAREIGPMEPMVISFGRIEGGGARNVVADEVTLVGTARMLSPELAKEVPQLIRRTVDGICNARGATFEMIESASYPVLVNDAATNRVYESLHREMFGEDTVERLEPVLGGEDFACYLEKVPGAMFRLGIRNTDIKADKPWHSPEFMVDESAIYNGTSLLASAAVRFLQEQTP